MWKVHQINKISFDDLNDDHDALKPTCPVCKEGVDEAIAAFN